MEQQHERRLHDAGVLQIPAGEAVGIQGLDGLVVDEVPVRQELDLHVADAVLARFLQRQLGAFEDELVVLVMTVHQHDLARTM